MHLHKTSRPSTVPTHAKFALQYALNIKLISNFVESAPICFSHRVNLLCQHRLQELILPLQLNNSRLELFSLIIELLRCFLQLLLALLLLLSEPSAGCKITLAFLVLG